MSANPNNENAMAGIGGKAGWPYPERPGPIAVKPPASALAAALAKAQGEFQPILRDKTVKVTMKSGGNYSFSYAPLESILHAVMPALSANGLALTQSVGIAEGKPVVRTELMHAEGESIFNQVQIMVREEGPQAYGSGLTYARRYGVTLLLCVCADEDDDGNSAEGNQAETTKTRAPSKRALAGRDAFRDALPGEDDAAIYAIHLDLLKEDDTVYREAWDLLDSKERSTIKAAISRSKAAA